MVRPCEYTAALGAEICDRLSAGATLKEIARDKTMPCVSTMTRWVVEDREGFAADYLRARQCQGHVLADELIEMIIGLTKDIPDGQSAMPHVLARKYQLDNVRWFLAKLLRHDYGKRYEVQQTSRCDVVIWLPGKPGMTSRDHVIEGQARHMLEDQSDD